MTRTEGSLSSARAKEPSWRSPAERREPPSPTSKRKALFSFLMKGDLPPLVAPTSYLEELHYADVGGRRVGRL